MESAAETRRFFFANKRLIALLQAKKEPD